MGITVATVTGANTVSVAEHMVIVALALIKGLVPAHNQLAQGVIQNVLRFLEGRPLADVVVQGTRA